MNTKHKHALLDFFLQQHNRSEMDNALRDLLSESELADISNRLQIFRLLEQGLTQRDVAERLGVGIATVTRGAKALKARQSTRT